jgi:hypothetical protein
MYPSLCKTKCIQNHNFIDEYSWNDLKSRNTHLLIFVSETFVFLSTYNAKRQIAENLILPITFREEKRLGVTVFKRKGSCATSRKVPGSNRIGF